MSFNSCNFLAHSILSQISKPARYTGGEYNSIRKNPKDVDVEFVLSMPDVYEVGQSNLGLKILYNILNQRTDTLAERVYAPWVDLEEKMRENDIPLASLESNRPLKEFDVIGFTLQYELSYTNVINMIDLAKIPMFARDRSDNDPLIVCGGPCTFNSEPLADFIDFFILGEGEEVIEEVVEKVALWKKNNKIGGRTGILEELATLKGVYVPSFYEVTYLENGQVKDIEVINNKAKKMVTKRIIQDLDKSLFPLKPIVPYIGIVHDRIMLELFRGCTRGCRFCQAGVIYRPVRERKLETLLDYANKLVENTGYEEISLISLSSADYSRLEELIDNLMENFKDQHVSTSLPSLRIDSFSIELAKRVKTVRKSGLTFAPEAGTQRMRNVINKNVTEKNLEDAARAAFESGWTSLKLYFMIGLPTETDEDVKGIADLAKNVIDIYHDVTGKRNVSITVSVSSFVPKPHTPFQWFGQNTQAETERKQALLRSLIKDRRISLNWHDAETSFLEGVFARGDRRLGKVILAAWQNGAKFDGWSEHFKFDVWLKAFENTDIDPNFYNTRSRDFDEKLPWDHLSAGANKEFLQKEYECAILESSTPDCRNGACTNCGVCQNLFLEERAINGESNA
ncbi:TIGR03960 family B12-binding radical SAM protein [Selenomonadales bacterium OttesenSCG-928-I06]|nr:TIGR03960 family B12-binding radical SAM protein [Selenomonadales bacterium OttesenSCG-928-I06]